MFRSVVLGMACQAIGDVHELLLYYEIPGVMILHLNVFRLRVVDRIPTDVYCTL